MFWQFLWFLKPIFWELLGRKFWGKKYMLLVLLITHDYNYNNETSMLVKTGDLQKISWFYFTCRIVKTPTR